MADLNSLIAQGAQFQAPVDPFASYAKMQQLQQGQQANQLAQMKMQEYQRGIEEQNRLRALDPNAADYESQLFRVKPELGIAYRKEQAATAASKAAAGSSQATAAATKQKILSQAMRDISGNPSDAQISAHNEDVQASSLFSDAEKAQVAKTASSLLTMPYEQRKTTMASQGVSAGELKPTITPQTLGGTVQAISTPAFGGAATVVPGSVSNVTMTPYQIEQNKISQGQLKVSQGQLANAQNRLQAEMSTGNLTPATVDFVAETYRQTGQMPPLGMGPMAATARSKILSRAAELSMGSGKTAAEGAADVRANKAETAGATASQRTLGNQIANVQIAANEANKMIDVAKPYVDKVNPTDYPTLNAAGNYVAAKTGDTNIVGLATALNGLVNTYARAINPKGTATVSDKQHAREIINTAMSKGQLNEAFAVMNQEMGAALASGPETRAAMRPNITKQPAAPATTKSGSTVSNW
jgi:hypothetical protein